MYVQYIKNRNSPGCWLLRKSTRVDGKPTTTTIANLTDWPAEIREGFCALLKGARVISPDKMFTIERSYAHGHSLAIIQTMKQLNIESLLKGVSPGNLRLIKAMIAQRIIHPASELAAAYALDEKNTHSSLNRILGLGEVKPADLYGALDSLEEQWGGIEQRLRKPLLKDDTIFLYDLSSFWNEGSHCPLAEYGYSRDGKRDKRQIELGVMTNRYGVPVGVQVFKGNRSDGTTAAEQLEKLRKLGKSIVFVGDQGMVTAKNIKEEMLDNGDWIRWLGALSAPAVKKLLSTQSITPELFDETDLCETHSEDFPGERLIVCRNPYLAQERRNKRLELLSAAENKLCSIQKAARRATRALRGKVKIAERYGRVIEKYKMGKHFNVEIRDDDFLFSRNEESIGEEEACDGVYILRTNVESDRMQPLECVENYKNLQRVEEVFRCLKTAELQARPIHHRLESRVKGYFYLCLLAYYVEFAMREKLKPLLFMDEYQDKSRQSSPVRKALRSAHGNHKAEPKVNEEGYPVMSFRSLIDSLAAVVIIDIRPAVDKAPCYSQGSELNPFHTKVFDLLNIQYNPMQTGMCKQ